MGDGGREITDSCVVGSLRPASTNICCFFESHTSVSMSGTTAFSFISAIVLIERV